MLQPPGHPASLPLSENYTFAVAAPAASATVLSGHGFLPPSLSGQGLPPAPPLLPAKPNPAGRHMLMELEAAKAEENVPAAPMLAAIDCRAGGKAPEKRGGGWWQGHMGSAIGCLWPCWQMLMQALTAWFQRPSQACSRQSFSLSGKTADCPLLTAAMERVWVTQLGHPPGTLLAKLCAKLCAKDWPPKVMLKAMALAAAALFPPQAVWATAWANAPVADPPAPL